MKLPSGSILNWKPFPSPTETLQVLENDWEPIRNFTTSFNVQQTTNANYKVALHRSLIITQNLLIIFQKIEFPKIPKCTKVVRRFLKFNR